MQNCILAAAIVFALVPVPAAAISYDAVAEFSTVSPTGIWSYGVGNIGSSFTEMSRITTVSGEYSYWQTDPASTVSDVPLVGKNVSAAIIDRVGLWYPTDRLFLHPGAFDSQDAIIRFLAPVSGRYIFSGRIGQIDLDAKDVIASGFGPFGELFSFRLNLPAPSIAQYGDDFSFYGAINLASGQALYFGVNKGTRPDPVWGVLHTNDSTAISLSINYSAVPEPASWAMLIGGFGLTGAAMRRRRLIAA